MKSKIHWLLVFVCVAVVCLVGWTGHSQNSSRIKWEYEIIHSQNTTDAEAKEMLNRRGGEGWELIHYEPYASGTIRGFYYFKRPK